MTAENKLEIEQFLAAVVQGCAKYITNEKQFSFDIKFQIGDAIYRLSMMEQKQEKDYLKDN